MESHLRNNSRFAIGLWVFAVVSVLYLAGPLAWVFEKAAFISAVPALLVLSGVLRRLVEWHLGKQKLPIANDAVLVTGCDSGFGQILAKRLVDRGYTVFAACYFPDGEGAKDLRGYSPRVSVVPLDVTSCESVDAAKAAIQEELQQKGLRLWAVVANAGVAQQGPLEWTSMQEVQQVFDVNTFGVLRTVKAFLPFIRKSKGRVVVTSSMLATIANPLVVPYSMSKAAVKNLVEGLQRELGQFGIYCSSIEPTYYATNMLRLRTMVDYEEKFASLDEQTKTDYKGYLGVCKRYFESTYGVITSTNLEEPLSAFEHAVCSTRPLPYYTVDNPAMATAREVLKHLNIEFTDAAVHFVQYLATIAKRTGLWKKHD